MFDSRVLVDKVQKVSHKCLLVHVAPTGQTRDNLNRKRTMEGTEYKMGNRNYSWNHRNTQIQQV